MKKVVIAGASGMVGSLVLEHCLAAPEIDRVSSLVRKRMDREHTKLEEFQVDDFKDFSKLTEAFQKVDIAFFCIGVYTGQVPDWLFKEITVDYAVAFARAVHKANPKATLCLLSGAGADRSEKSRTSFARYKGMAENQISDLGLDFHTFRPAYIYPVTPRKEPNFFVQSLKGIVPDDPTLWSG